MKLNIDYITSENILKDEEKYLMKYKKEINNIAEDIIIRELFKLWIQDNIELKISQIKCIVRDMSVSITFINEEEIKELNKEYRNIDKITDVLSFPIQSPSEVKALKRCINNERKKQLEKKSTMYSEILLGDIFICLPRIREQAKEYEHSVERELMYMIVHGMYHLLGYDHIEDADKKIMRKREEYTLNKFKFGLDGGTIEKRK